MVLYFMFLKYMLLLFLFMSILSIPSLIFYWKGNAVDLSEYSNLKYGIAAFSLGNIGESKLFLDCLIILQVNLLVIVPNLKNNKYPFFAHMVHSKKYLCLVQCKEGLVKIVKKPQKMMASNFPLLYVISQNLKNISKLNLQTILKVTAQVKTIVISLSTDSNCQTVAYMMNMEYL